MRGCSRRAWVSKAPPGMDGVVHAAGLAGELFGPDERGNLVNDGDLQMATARVATAGDRARPPHRSPRSIRWRLAAPCSSRRSMRSATAWRASMPVRATCRRSRRATSGPPPSSGWKSRARRSGAASASARAATMSSYGPISERASLFGELQLLVDSIALSPTAALLAATRDAARAIGGEPGRRIGTIEAGHYADLVLLSKNPLEDIGESRGGGVGDARREALAAGAAAERDCDEVTERTERAGRRDGETETDGAVTTRIAVHLRCVRRVSVYRPSRLVAVTSPPATTCPPPTRSTTPRRSAPAGSPADSAT